MIEQPELTPSKPIKALPFPPKPASLPPAAKVSQVILSPISDMFYAGVALFAAKWGILPHEHFATILFMLIGIKAALSKVISGRDMLALIQRGRD